MILNCYKVKFLSEFRVISRFWKATTAKRIKLDL